MKKKIYVIFHPNKFIGIPICIISTILLIIVFSYHLEYTPLAYTSYFLSTYALILFIIWFIKACKFSSDEIKRTKTYKWYDKNRNTITKYTLIVSSFINLSFGVFEFAMGLYYKSWWLITFAVYYLILCYMKVFLLKDVKEFGSNLKQEYKKLKNTGYTLLLLNAILMGIIILVLYQNSSNTYSNNLIYGVALYDFYLIIIAIINVCKYKKNKSPVISASKCISLSVAMISMLSLEVSMIYQFGENTTNFKLIMVSITGFAVTMINTIESIIMIKKANNNLHSKIKRT